MKKGLKKLGIIFLLIMIIIIVLMILKTNFMYAETSELTASLQTTKTSYLVGDDIQIKIKTNQKVMTSSFYLNYDSSMVTFKKVETASVSTKDYPEDNLVRVVYADMSGKGTNEIILTFGLKSNSKSVAKFYLSNTTMSAVETKKSYKQSQIGGINELNITVSGKAQDSGNTEKEQVQNITNEEIKTNTNDKTKAKTEIPKTGENDIVLFTLIFTILVSAYLGYRTKKLKGYFKN